MHVLLFFKTEYGKAIHLATGEVAKTFGRLARLQTLGCRGAANAHVFFAIYLLVQYCIAAVGLGGETDEAPFDLR